MDEAQLAARYERLGVFEGAWKGEERLAHSPWAPAGTARGEAGRATRFASRSARRGEKRATPSASRTTSTTTATKTGMAKTKTPRYSSPLPTFDRSKGSRAPVA